MAFRVALATLIVTVTLVADVRAQSSITVNSLTQLRSLGAGGLSNYNITLSPNHGDPHPVTGVITPGEYWINGDHIADPTGTTPVFLDLLGSGNTFDFAGTTLKLDTRKLDGFGRALGHGSGVRVVQIGGSSNTVTDITLIGEDLELDTDPDAQRWADWAATYMRVTGDSNTVDGAHILSRGSSPYGLSDAFGKGARVFPQGEPADEGGLPWIGHNKTSNFLVRDATNTTINDVHLDVRSYGHGFFVQKASDTTLTNSTVTGELVPSTNVINHEKYQEYGVMAQGAQIPNDIFISTGEDGVRAYGSIDGVPVSGLRVENVVVTNMRQGFAVSVARTNSSSGMGVELNNVEAYGNEVGFTPGTDNVITNAKGDIENGPLIWFQYNNTRDTSIDIEVVGDLPVGQDYAVAYLNGQRLDVTIDSDLDLGDLPEDSMVRLGQTYFNNWRDGSNPTGPEDSDPGDFIDSTINNNTNQMLVLGQLATNNTISSQAPVVPNGKDTPYDGISFVPSGLRVVLTDAQGLGNNGTAVDGTLDSNASIVESGGTLELSSRIRISNEKLTISGDGVDGLGALYTSATGTRFGSSSGTDESTIFLDGDASIGVGGSGDLLVGAIQGTGNLTKLGTGKLSLEKSNTLAGDLIVAAGEVSVRGNGVRHGLTVAAGATIAPLSDNGYNTTSLAHIDGTLDLNGRTDGNALSQQVGSLSGAGLVTTTNDSGSAGATLTLAGESGTTDFAGQITTTIGLNKTGASTQILSGNNTYTGTTTVTGGTLLVNGDHTGGGDYMVAGGTLGGSGSVDASIMVESGGSVAPGNSAGMLTVDEIAFMTGSTFEIEIGGLTAGTEYDLLLASSTALGGDLAVSLLDLGSGEFVPDAASIFSILASTSLSGEFDNVANGERIDTAGGEGSFLVTYTGSMVQLSDFQLASLPGDFDLDGDVDGSDFLAWQRQGLGQEALEQWQHAYAGNSGIGATQSVPEPTILVTMGVGTVCIGSLRWRRG